ncbi:hypothetical protein BCR37DRAFT_342801 [Protomyces lactucae-debilis]|uniref:Domain of unknown function at the cortex 1 domain-containing protein n=1 Tax=Protomyces lactucae-debilis TaxID=2754530 RepID=A0A1Y2FW69_PROLT|nr:uncharacterized protein BCR37DRAFT_342801 [Protomyces lactucae-debilis]ORY87787.1 hypothetical protein BCR37DRAFT_342801 [Protomyces lactucae-debilis]
MSAHDKKLTLKVSIGSSVDQLQPAHVNDPSQPTHVSNDTFQGDILVRIKGYNNTDLTEEEYFNKTKNTSSVQIRGQIKADLNADDVLFGNDFDAPIASSLPPGTSLGLKAMKWIDPGLETDLYCDKPWAFSPFITTMTVLKTSNGACGEGPMALVEEDTSSLLGEKLPSKQRRNYFATKANRAKYSLSNATCIEGDFCNGFIDFEDMAVALPYVNLKLSILKYWKGQPFRYTCKTRDGKMLFCVVFELVEE